MTTITLPGLYLYGISLETGGNSGGPDYIFQNPSSGFSLNNDSFGVLSSSRKVSTTAQLVQLSNGVMYDPFQTYDAPQVIGSQTYSFKAYGSNRTGATTAATQMDLFYHGKRVYIFTYDLSGGNASIYRHLARLNGVAKTYASGFRDILTNLDLEFDIISQTATFITTISFSY